MWIVVTVAVLLTFVMTWLAYRCQAYTNTCNASRTAQILIPVGDIEAARACANASTFVCLILTPANLPTLYLVVLGLGGIIVGIGTLGIIQKQAEVAERDLIIASRAFLSVGGEPENTESGEIRIPIENRGRVPAKIQAVEITVIVIQVADGKAIELYKRSIKPEVHEETVVPGDPHFSLFAHLPEVAKSATCQFAVAGTVKYDIGFSGTTDVLTFVRSYTVKYKVWLKGWSGISADFREDTGTEMRTDIEKKNPN